MEEHQTKSRIWFWWLVFAFIIFLITLALLRFPDLASIHIEVDKPTPGQYSVRQFVDGDTIVVNMNGQAETVRMIGVDTPETHRPNSPVECFGREAAAYTKNVIGNNKVRLEADPLNTNRDRYDRLLRYVYLPDGTLVEEKLIKDGYAFAYTQFPFSRKLQFALKELSAKRAGLGLWSACSVSTDERGAHHTNALN